MSHGIIAVSSEKLYHDSTRKIDVLFEYDSDRRRVGRMAHHQLPNRPSA
jgi:hypothetical protein